MRPALAALAIGAALAAAPPARRPHGEYWVAAEPVTWNIVPNRRDAIMGTTYDPSDTVSPTSSTGASAQLAHAAAEHPGRLPATRT